MSSIRYSTSYTSSAMATPATQKAWIVERMGHPSRALKFVSDWPVPSEIPKNQVLVKIQPVARNPFWHLTSLSCLQGYSYRSVSEFIDAHPRRTYRHGRTRIQSPRPRTLCRSPFRQHRRSRTRQAEVPWRGTLARYALVPDICVTKRPFNIDVIHVSRLTLASLTAWQSLNCTHLWERGSRIIRNSDRESTRDQGRRERIRQERGISPENGSDEFIDYTKEPISKRTRLI
ncbi:hypothetical protein BDN71DRAFT_1439580 [Pleurotus eryngii]|uniref:Uncharacterized protein n=1 Tax=Pleurotus eryngii TaxID=5323 RepID=A0A9P6DKV7_PLEER|nr:hypothetical protein BDN71DRAFT_1439580 [Pleurotus eryngii]